MNRTERVELPDGGWYERELDERGRVIGTRNSGGAWSRIVWGDTNVLLSYIDSNGDTASRTHSPEGNTTYEFKSGQGVVFIKWVKDPIGRCLSYEDPNGAWECLAFDGRYNLVYSPKIERYRAVCRSFTRDKALAYWKAKLTTSKQAKLFYEAILNHNPVKETLQ